jgi:murein DD-endopeptidase
MFKKVMSLVLSAFVIFASLLLPEVSEASPSVLFKVLSKKLYSAPSKTSSSASSNTSSSTTSKTSPSTTSKELPSTPSKTVSTKPSWQVKAEAIEQEARKHLGPYYRYGYAGPKYFDCSGFVQYLYKNVAQISLPRTAAEQAKAGTQVSLKDARKGDLLFFSSDGVRIIHVGIYLGDGKMIHASSSKNGIRISDIYTPYYTRTFKTARRVLY